jgi:hypothetical protein
MELPRVRVLKAGRARPDVPARRVPLMMRWCIRLGTFSTQAMWAVALAGIGIALAVLPKVKLWLPDYSAGATAEITSFANTRLEYRYFDRTGVEHTGDAVSSERHRVGDLFVIWYDPSNPARSTAPWTDYYRPGPGSLALLSVPGGALIAAALLMWRRREFRLLRYGHPAAIRPMHDRGDPSVITFDYRTETGATRTTQIPRLRRYADRAPETALYDPTNPDHAIVLDELPTRPVLLGDRLVATSLSLAVFPIPIATLAAAVLLAVRCLG